MTLSLTLEHHHDQSSDPPGSSTTLGDRYNHNTHEENPSKSIGALKLNIMFVSSLSTGQSRDSKVHQTPTAFIKGPGENVQLSCSHAITSYYMILWYQQSAGDTALKLIGYASYESITMEAPFQKHFNVSGDGSKEAFLHILDLRQREDSAEYFCAASYAQCCRCLSPSTKTLSNKKSQYLSAHHPHLLVRLHLVLCHHVKTDSLWCTTVQLFYLV